ncbi:MAG: haloacid dehalogenase type II [Rhodanobacteraceae bacterium]
MQIDRRHFLRLGGYAIASAAAAKPVPSVEAVMPPRAILFDAFAIFDPRSVKSVVEAHVRDAPAEFHELWRNRIFEFQWLHALSGRYVDFAACATEALEFAMATLKVDLSSSAKRNLVEAFSNLTPWNDVDEGLTALAASGVSTGFLSNMTEPMLRSNMRRNHLEGRFDFVLSTDSVHTFKPDPRAYELGCTALNVAKTDVLFAAFAGWDAAGAKWFGFPTYWVNRTGARPEFAIRTDGEGADLRALARFVRERGKSPN